VEIERNGKEVRVILNSAKPGIVLGQNGEDVKSLEKELAKHIKDRSITFKIDVVEVKNPDLSAQIAADEIAMALENRGSFRLAQKRVIRRVMKAGAKGIKTRVSGRLNGVDMARAEGYSHGVVPLATFRNDIDYGFAEALTTYGIIGVKV
jgi:small subunit ribosomal protein S3